MRRPLIGITLRYETPSPNPRYPTHEAFEYNHSRWANVIFENGGYPVYLPTMPVNGGISDELDFLDGILLSGGEDVEPEFYGRAREPHCRRSSPQRDDFEICLVKMSLRKCKPLLGVCRGMQVINVALGGTLYQDIGVLERKAIDHQNTENFDYSRIHKVSIMDDSKIAAIIGGPTLEVNTSHHQSVDRLGKALRITAHADDEIIEAIEYEGDSFLIGVQWHPEAMPEAKSTQLLMSSFIKECRSH